MKKNKLQYLYSILVLSGVLASSYFMVEQRPSSLPTLRPQQAMTYQSEPVLSAPGIDQLIQFESQFKQLEEKAITQQKRQLTENQKAKRLHAVPR